MGKNKGKIKRFKTIFFFFYGKPGHQANLLENSISFFFSFLNHPLEKHAHAGIAYSACTIQPLRHFCWLTQLILKNGVCTLSSICQGLLMKNFQRFLCFQIAIPWSIIEVEKGYLFWIDQNFAKNWWHCYQWVRPAKLRLMPAKLVEFWDVACGPPFRKGPKMSGDHQIFPAI